MNTKHGMVKTDHILFIASGAFHLSKPSDLIPELQGRFPIRVELGSLSVDDFEAILTQTHASLVKQYTLLLATEGVTLQLSPGAIRRVAQIACDVNERTEHRRAPLAREERLIARELRAPNIRPNVASTPRGRPARGLARTRPLALLLYASLRRGPYKKHGSKRPRLHRIRMKHASYARGEAPVIAARYGPEQPPSAQRTPSSTSSDGVLASTPSAASS